MARQLDARFPGNTLTMEWDGYSLIVRGRIEPAWRAKALSLAQQHFSHVRDETTATPPPARLRLELLRVPPNSAFDNWLNVEIVGHDGAQRIAAIERDAASDGHNASLRFWVRSKPESTKGLARLRSMPMRMWQRTAESGDGLYEFGIYLASQRAIATTDRDVDRTDQLPLRIALSVASLERGRIRLEPTVRVGMPGGKFSDSKWKIVDFMVEIGPDEMLIADITNLLAPNLKLPPEGLRILLTCAGAEPVEAPATPKCCTPSGAPAPRH